MKYIQKSIFCDLLVFQLNVLVFQYIMYENIFEKPSCILCPCCKTDIRSNKKYQKHIRFPKFTMKNILQVIIGQNKDFTNY